MARLQQPVYWIGGAMKWLTQRSRNPFGLTDRQAEAVQLLVDLGADKLVAARLGLVDKSATRLLLEAQRAAGVNSRVLLALAWDRAHRQAGATRHRGVGL